MRIAMAVLISGITMAVAAAQGLQKVNPPGLSAPQTYTHVVRAGNLTFIAGQVGTDDQGRLAGPGMLAQTEQVMRNLQTALRSQKIGFADVAKITIFTTSIEEFRAPEVAAVRAKYFGAARPASTLVQVSRLASPEFKVEIEAIAVVP